MGIDRLLKTYLANKSNSPGLCCGSCISTIIILIVVLVLSSRSLKARVVSVIVEDLSINSSSSSSPSFNMKLTALVSVKNINFGGFRFHNSTMTIFYRGFDVGEGIVMKGYAKGRSTGKFNVTVNLNSANVSTNSTNSVGDLSSGILTLNSQAKVKGELHNFILFFNKKKSADMNCIMNVNTTSKAIQNFKC
ncbi:Late embryogenesis abundant protein [Quillaja saponaria]|uniref:Late embryogenesis abundant protein n=1 Tax=Quillaja saponaria TaxID=32244 RepID=A0AAD7LNP3_QUISA|nr:Late embryogenesis abundant protein [Quillaja saponaria]